MKLFHQPPARRLLLLLGTMTLVAVAGCQSSRMAKVPGMGWMSSHKGVNAQDDSLTAYPAPSASAVPTTITDSRASAANAGLAGSVRGPGGGGELNGPLPSGGAYPETQHASLPPAPAATPRAVVSPAAYASAGQSPAAQAAYGSPQAATSAAPANLSDDVQRGLYPAADSGSATTWGATADNAHPAETHPASSTGIGPAGGTPPAGPAYANHSGPSSSRAESDFAPYPGPALAAGSYVAPAAYDSPASPATNSAADEFSRYDQGAYPPIASTTNQAMPAGSAMPVTNAYATNPQPGSSSPATATATAAGTASPTGSHYATIAADQVHSPRSGPWRPGSTSRLEGGAAMAWQSSHATNSTANAQATTIAAPHGQGGWE